MRTESGKPSDSITSADLSHPPLGVNDAMFPLASIASTCTVPRPQRLEVMARHERDGLQLGRSLRPEAALEELGVAEAQPHRLLDPRLERFQVFSCEQTV